MRSKVIHVDVAMTVEDAIEALENVGHDFYVFKNKVRPAGATRDCVPGQLASLLTCSSDYGLKWPAIVVDLFFGVQVEAASNRTRCQLAYLLIGSLVGFPGSWAAVARNRTRCQRYYCFLCSVLATCRARASGMGGSTSCLPCHKGAPPP